MRRNYRKLKPKSYTIYGILTNCVDDGEDFIRNKQ